MAEVVVAVLVGIALLAVLLAGAGVLLARTPVGRLHFLAVITTVALPIFCAAAIVDQGLSATAATLALIAVIGAASGPVLAVAIGRVLARQAGVRADGVDRTGRIEGGQ